MSVGEKWITATPFHEGKTSEEARVFLKAHHASRPASSLRGARDGDVEGSSVTIVMYAVTPGVAVAPPYHTAGAALWP